MFVQRLKLLFKGQHRALAIFMRGIISPAIQYPIDPWKTDESK